MKYYNQQGEYQEEYQRLFEELVPAMGKADTESGEALRAISKIYHEFYNNGFVNALDVEEDECSECEGSGIDPYFSGEDGEDDTCEYCNGMCTEDGETKVNERWNSFVKTIGQYLGEEREIELREFMTSIDKCNSILDKIITEIVVKTVSS